MYFSGLVFYVKAKIERSKMKNGFIKIL